MSGDITTMQVSSIESLDVSMQCHIIDLVGLVSGSVRGRIATAQRVKKKAREPYLFTFYRKKEGCRRVKTKIREYSRLMLKDKQVCVYIMVSEGM